MALSLSVQDRSNTYRRTGGYVSRLALTPQVLLILSSLLYLSPVLFSGSNIILDRGVRYFFEYSPEVRPIVAIICVCLLPLLFLREKQVSVNLGGAIKIEALLIFGFLILLGAYTLATPELFSGSKRLSLGATNGFHAAFYNLCIMSVLFSLMTGWRRSLFVLLAGVLGLLLAMYIGHRSYVAVTILGSLYLIFRNRSVLSVKTRYAVVILMSFIGLALFKSVYLAIKMGDYSRAIEALQPANLILSMQSGMEQFITFRILDMVVTQNFEATCSNLIYLPIAIFPLTDAFIDYAACSFNQQMQPVLFSFYSGGVAANPWAEFFSNYGVFGIPLLIGVVLLMCRAIEFVIGKVRSPVLISGLVVALIQLTFYIQRNELLQAITFARRAILVAIAIYLISEVIFRLSRPAHRRQ